MEQEEEIIYHGDRRCQAKHKDGTSCKYGAYWQSRLYGITKLHCGVHKSKKAVALRKRSLTEQNMRVREAQAQHEVECEIAAAENRAHDRPAQLWLQKMKMKQAPRRLPGGILNVFPNDKHGNRRDGLGLCKLSPKQLGPVFHGQPGLPDPATCVENLHQANKVFPTEVDAEGRPLPRFFARQRELYEDQEAWRHKLGRTKEEHMRNAGIPPGNNANHCLYSVWVQPDGSLRAFTYVESRQFYCCYYEELALREGQLVALERRFKTNRMNICLVGYDAPEQYCVPTHDVEAMRKVFYARYLDTSSPFGHEYVLACMLCLPRDLWPWKIYTSEGRPMERAPVL